MRVSLFFLFIVGELFVAGIFSMKIASCDVRERTATCRSLPREIYEEVLTVFWRGYVLPFHVDILEKFPNLGRFVCLREVECGDPLSSSLVLLRMDECACRRKGEL
jgi:hypothetical protein